MSEVEEKIVNPDSEDISASEEEPDVQATPDKPEEEVHVVAGEVEVDLAVGPEAPGLLGRLRKLPGHGNKKRSACTALTDLFSFRYCILVAPLFGPFGTFRRALLRATAIGLFLSKDLLSVLLRYDLLA